MLIVMFINILKTMKINEIKNILDYAREYGRIVTITLVSGQVSHINFIKKTKMFTATDDVILDVEGHLVIKYDTDGSVDYIDSDSIIRIFSKEGL